MNFGCFLPGMSSTVRCACSVEGGKEEGSREGRKEGRKEGKEGKGIYIWNYVYHTEA